METPTAPIDNLPTDRYAFPIVTTMEDLEKVAAQKATKFKVVCPECGRQFMRTLGAAGLILIFNCKQHD